MVGMVKKPLCWLSCNDRNPRILQIEKFHYLGGIFMIENFEDIKEDTIICFGKILTSNSSRNKPENPFQNYELAKKLFQDQN